MWKGQRRDVCGPWGEFSWGEDKLQGLNQGLQAKGADPLEHRIVEPVQKLPGIFVLGLGTGTCALGLPGLCLDLRDMGVWCGLSKVGGLTESGFRGTGIMSNLWSGLC